MREATVPFRRKGYSSFFIILRWRIQSIRYDAFNRLIGMNQPSLRQVTYAHDLCENRVLLKKKPDSNTLYYYLYNGHGDVIGILYDNGTVANTYDYDEFGNMVAEQEKTYNPFKYAGEYQDAESGLYYFNTRYYDPSMGRFINEDSVEGQASRIWL